VFVLFFVSPAKNIQNYNLGKDKKPSGKTKVCRLTIYFTFCQKRNPENFIRASQEMSYVSSDYIIAGIVMGE
jgi:hypothetical protein